MAKNILYIQWLELWYSRLNDIDVTAALIYEPCIWGEAVKRLGGPNGNNMFRCPQRDSLG